MRSLFCGLALALSLSAQIAVNPQRIAGIPESEWPIGDGGLAVDALFMPTAVALDRGGNLWIADGRSQHIRKVTPDGRIATFVDGAKNGLGSIHTIVVDSRGDLYITDYGQHWRVLRVRSPKHLIPTDIA